ncbi:hypothetical protein F4779DRAFT_612440 [Xylariaceae sp. FL0662B]|nr:hypothetical protein F4779DRAFT_612440 [Xylariaceae sp. FL0662B]
MQDFVANGEAYPGVNVGNDYDSVEASIRRSFMTVYHGSCTCAMGKINDPGVVVDPQGSFYYRWEPSGRHLQPEAHSSRILSRSSHPRSIKEGSYTIRPSDL